MSPTSCPQVHYRAIYYYLDEHPELLVDLLNTLQSRVDHARVVELVRKTGHLPLIKEYLLAVQKNNVSEVRLGSESARDSSSPGIKR